MTGMTTITSKRQMTIPAKLFRELNLQEGDRLIVTEVGGELRLKKATAMVMKYAGLLAPQGKPVDLDKAISQAKLARFSQSPV